MSDPAVVGPVVVLSWSPIRQQYQVFVWTGQDAHGGATWRIEWWDAWDAEAKEDRG